MIIKIPATIIVQLYYDISIFGARNYRRLSLVIDGIIEKAAIRIITVAAVAATTTTAITRAAGDNS